uniref:Uncharacterized protein n=1 Tax=Anopheles coluzzii TaxID=1518534 RepID=A0A8W7PEK2_ANOCL
MAQDDVAPEDDEEDRRSHQILKCPIRRQRYALRVEEVDRTVARFGQHAQLQLRIALRHNVRPIDRKRSTAVRYRPLDNDPVRTVANVHVKVGHIGRGGNVPVHNQLSAEAIRQRTEGVIFNSRNTRQQLIGHVVQPLAGKRTGPSTLQLPVKPPDRGQQPEMVEQLRQSSSKPCVLLSIVVSRLCDKSSRRNETNPKKAPFGTDRSTLRDMLRVSSCSSPSNARSATVSNPLSVSCSSNRMGNRPNAPFGSSEMLLCARYRYCMVPRSEKLSFGTVEIPFDTRCKRCRVSSPAKLPRARLLPNRLWLRSSPSSEFMEAQPGRFGQRASRNVPQAVVAEIELEQRWQRAERGRANLFERIVAQVEVAQGEQVLKDGIVDVRDVVVRHVDRVQLVQLREGVFRYLDEIVVRNVQDLQPGHVREGQLRHVGEQIVRDDPLRRVGRLVEGGPGDGADQIVGQIEHGHTTLELCPCEGPFRQQLDLMSIEVEYLQEA